MKRRMRMFVVALTLSAPFGSMSTALSGSSLLADTTIESAFATSFTCKATVCDCPAASFAPCTIEVSCCILVAMGSAHAMVRTMPTTNIAAPPISTK